MCSSLSPSVKLLKSDRKHSKSLPVFSQVVPNGRSKVDLSDLLPVNGFHGSREQVFLHFVSLRESHGSSLALFFVMFSPFAASSRESILWGIRFHWKDPEGWLRKTGRKLQSVWSTPAIALYLCGSDKLQTDSCNPWKSVHWQQIWQIHRPFSQVQFGHRPLDVVINSCWPWLPLPSTEESSRTLAADGLGRTRAL